VGADGAEWAAPSQAPTVRSESRNQLCANFTLRSDPRACDPARVWPTHGRRADPSEPRSAARALHDLPEEILIAIMSQLIGNDAVKLASLHPALRRALRAVPSLQPSVALDFDSSPIGGARTRSETAAERKRRRRSNSFAAFRVAHPGVAVEAVSVQLAPTEGLPEDVYYGANFVLDVMLPLRSLKRLRMETNPHGVSHEVRAARTGTRRTASSACLAAGISPYRAPSHSGTSSDLLSIRSAAAV